MRMMLRDVRLAFPSLWKMSAPKGKDGSGEPAYSAAFIFPKDHKQIKEIEAAIDAVAKEKWGVKALAQLKALRASDKTCLHDGDTKTQYDGFEGNAFLSTRTKIRPGVYDAERNDLGEQDGKPYAGCYVNASIEIWAQENGYGKRINAQLRGVQFLRDGDRFGGGSGPADADEFPDEIGVEGSEADEDLTA